MSCHDIGHGLNSVAMVVIDLYDHGEISTEAARKLLHQCCQGVYWCDGNEYEAVECCSENRCGYCLQKLEIGTPLFHLYDILYRMYDGHVFGSEASPVRKCVSQKSGYPDFCEDCLIKLLTEACGDKEKVLEAIKQMKAEVDIHDWSVNEGNQSEKYCKYYYASKEKE